MVNRFLKTPSAVQSAPRLDSMPEGLPIMLVSSATSSSSNQNRFPAEPTSDCLFAMVRKKLLAALQATLQAFCMRHLHRDQASTIAVRWA